MKCQAEAVPIKAVGKREMFWMDAKLKQLILKRDESRIDLRIYRTLRQETNREIFRLTEESMLETLHRHVDRIFKCKDANQAWLLFAPYLGGNLTSLEGLYCTKVECTPAIAQWPKLSLKSTGRSAGTKVISNPGM